MRKEWKGIAIPEYYESKLSLQALSIPLMLRLSTKSLWSVSIGYGLSYHMDYQAKVDYVYEDWFTPGARRTEITERSLEPENDLNAYFTAGFGKGFEINDLKLTTKIFYTFCFADYRLEHIGVNQAEILYFYDISPQYIGLEIGIGL